MYHVKKWQKSFLCSSCCDQKKGRFTEVIEKNKSEKKKQALLRWAAQVEAEVLVEQQMFV